MFFSGDRDRRQPSKKVRRMIQSRKSQMTEKFICTDDDKKGLPGGDSTKGRPVRTWT